LQAGRFSEERLVSTSGVQAFEDRGSARREKVSRGLTPTTTPACPEFGLVPSSCEFLKNEEINSGFRRMPDYG
jgi:hypothetical protein